MKRWVITATVLVATMAGAQEPEVELSEEEAAAVEQEVLESLGDGERTTAQLWDLATRLTRKRAYCKAVDYLLEIEEAEGPIVENKGSAAQAFYVCARTRLGQGDAELAAQHLERSVKAAGERPEHRDMQFKLALVRARDAMKSEDIAAVRQNLEQAKSYGVDTGPGANPDRLADWALPVIQDTVREVGAWSHRLLEAQKPELAGEAAALALEYNPHDKLAAQVQRELTLGGGLVPMLALAGGGLLVLGVFWQLWRRRKLSQIAAGMDEFDDL